MLELNWNIGTPTEEGTYFVAAEYGPGTGMYEIMDWINGKWDCYPTINVIAYLSWDEFKRQLNIKWPGELPVFPVREVQKEDDSDFREE